MKNKRKRRNFIKPVEENIVMDDGYIGKFPHSKEDDITNKHYYTLSAKFPEHKLEFTIKSPIPVNLLETGPHPIVARLKKLRYEVPQYLVDMQRDIGVLWTALNTTVYGRLTSEGHQIEPNTFRETPDFWLYHATDDEIKTITKEMLIDADKTLRDVALRFFLHFRHMAIDTMAGMQVAEGDTDGTEIDTSAEAED